MTTIINANTEIWDILETVTDPEVPVLSILDLGIVRKVEQEGEEIIITITPTYTGCPAMDVIAINIKAAMQEAGYSKVAIKSVLSPAWTTDWLSEAGRRKLKAYGIAPPVGSSDKNSLLGETREVQCPRCDSTNTRMISQFGSTACKALHQCNDCLEPFDYFKCH
ncbi:MAG: 1,2-phenylacetyl-CoA epoxidase subunit PaaD [Bacteroidota bacterium]